MARKKATGKSKVRGHTARVVVVDEVHPVGGPSDHALRAALNAKRVRDSLLCATCNHRADEHEHGELDCEQGNWDDGCECMAFVLPNTYDRWAYTSCKCGRSRECNGVGVKACSECESDCGRRQYVHANGGDLADLNERCWKNRYVASIGPNGPTAWYKYAEDGSYTKVDYDPALTECDVCGADCVGACPPKRQSHVTRRESEGAGANAVERHGLDLNRYTLERILPGAAELCEQGIEREKALERDLPKPGEKRVVYVTEVRGMTAKIGGIIQEQRGWYKTTSQMPHGLKPIMGKSIGELHWCMRMSLMRERVTKDPEQARRMSSGNAITFVIVGGGIEIAGEP